MSWTRPPAMLKLLRIHHRPAFRTVLRSMKLLNRLCWCCRCFFIVTWLLKICFTVLLPCLIFTIHGQKNNSPDVMGALSLLVFKEGFLTTPFAECRGYPGTHTFNEGLSHYVHHGCPGTHTLKEGLSHFVHCGCTGTHIFFNIFFRRGDQFKFVFRHSMRQSSCIGIVFATGA